MDPGKKMTETYEDLQDEDFYKCITPTKVDHPYFSSKDAQDIFRCLLDVDNLQFSLLDITEQVEMMESIVLKR